jgi:hypothetical protein
VSPLPPILHIVAAVLGAWAALMLGAKVAPDLPNDEPGVIEAEPGQSLLSAGPFGVAMGQVEDQLGADETVVSLRAARKRIDVSSSESGEGVPIDEVSTSAPYLMAYQIGQKRPDVQGPEDLRLATFRATPQGGIWTVYLPPRFKPPHVYRAAIPAGAVAFQVHVTAVPGS